MNRSIFSRGLLCAVTLVCISAFCIPSTAAEMTFQLINDTERPLNLKFFSRAESRQEWPSKTKAYSVKPDSAVQQIKLTCEEGEQICWGAWMTTQRISGEINGAAGQRATQTSKSSTGAGERGLRTCERCCHICKDGAVTPATTLHDPKPDAK